MGAVGAIKLKVAAMAAAAAVAAADDDIDDDDADIGNDDDDDDEEEGYDDENLDTRMRGVSASTTSSCTSLSFLSNSSTTSS